MSIFLPNPFRERPIPLLDSAPHLAPSTLSTWISLATTHLAVAWTARPIPELESGHLRLEWSVDVNDSDGPGRRTGFKDYPLSQRVTARRAFDLLADTPDIVRVVVYGFAGQNPFCIGPEGERGSAFEQDRARRKRELRDAGFTFAHGEMEPEGEIEHDGMPVRDRSGQKAVGVDIDRIEDLIDRVDSTCQVQTKAYADEVEV